MASQAAGAQIGETEPPAPSPLERDVEADDAWALVRVVADEVGWDDAQAAGLVAAAESVERLALELNDAERIELARLLEDELKRSGV